MKKFRFLGACLYQADVKPKGARNFRRADVQTLVQYEIPAIAAADMVKDAVVVMPGDVRRVYPLKDGPRRRSYAGWNGALWRPLRLDGADAAAETFGASLMHFPGMRERATDDPILDAAVSAASIKAASVASIQRIEAGDVFHDDRFAGAYGWTNKAERVAAQLEAAAKLLVVVDGTIWKRDPGPAWMVEHVDGEPAAGGLVLLDEDRASWGARQDLFRPDRLEQAVGLSAKRFGQAEVLGTIEKMDARFVEYDDLTAAFRNHLGALLQRGDHMLPYLKGPAIRAFVELHAAFRGNSPLDPFASVDPDFVMDRIAILDEALADRGLPGRMLEAAAGFRASFRAVEERFASDRAARAKLAIAAEEEDALATLGAAP